MDRHNYEIDEGVRFEFGKNWENFLKYLDDERIDLAKASLCDTLEINSLNGRSFLDIGCGSGLFSLAAKMLGASVHSFDFDPASVACTRELKRRFFPTDPGWTIEQSSVLDKKKMMLLGSFDVVYCWGVLHHTGSMWQAMDIVADMVTDRGVLFLAIYNDQRSWSKLWRMVKKIYNLLPRSLRIPYVIAIMVPWELKSLVIAAAKLSIGDYVRSWTHYKSQSLRGMSRWHDMVDWVGGYPFEVAKPEDIFHFYRNKKFVLQHLRTCSGGSGCNQFVFWKLQETDQAPIRSRNSI